jgi:transcriptional regulator with XRE-family HTH domain
MDLIATKRVGELIRDARMKRQLNVAELARLADVSPATCSTARRGEGLQSLDPREPGADYYICIAGRLRLRLIDHYQPTLWVDIDPLPVSTCRLLSIYDNKLPDPLRKARLAVVPLAEIQAADIHPRRVIARIAARRAGADHGTT